MKHIQFFSESLELASPPLWYLLTGPESKEGRSGCTKHSPEQLPHKPQLSYIWKFKTYHCGSTQTPGSFKTTFLFSTDFHIRPFNAALCCLRQCRQTVAMATEAGSPLKRFSMAQRQPGSFCPSHQHGCPDLEGMPWERRRRELRLWALLFLVPPRSRPTPPPSSASSDSVFYDVAMRQQATNLAQTKQPLHEGGCH